MTSDDQSGGTFSHQYSWNAEGRMAAATTVGVSAETYTYDGDGHRVKKQTAGRLYWYGAGGEVLAETGPDGSNPTEYIFFAGRRIARRDSSGNVSYYLSDMLGSSRVVADSNGNLLDDCDFLPYGSELCVASSSGNHYLFTGLERDSESGLDHTLYRQYASNFGRWLTPDALGGRRIDPQTLNKYSYIRDNPLTLTDPLGLYLCNGSGYQCKEFEEARKRILNSKHSTAAELRAAQAYGDPGKDNGVSVGFGDPGKGKSGKTTARLQEDPSSPGHFRASAEVVIRSGESGTGLEAVVGHEGVHVADAQGLAATASNLGIDLSKDLTVFQTEINAYAVTAAVQAREHETASYGTCGGRPCNFGPGMTPDQVRSTTILLLLNPKNGYAHATQLPNGEWVNDLFLRQIPY